MSPFLTVAVAASLFSQEAAKLPDLPAVVRMLKDREAAIRNYSVRVKTTKVMLLGEKVGPKGASGGEYVTLRRVHFATFDRMGRFLVDSSGDSVAKQAEGGPARVFPHLWKCVYDGKTHKAMEGDTQYRFGRLAQSGAVEAQDFDARQFVSHFRSKPLSEFQSERSFGVVGRKAFAGREPLEIASKPDGVGLPDVAPGRFVLLIDDRRGGLLLRGARQLYPDAPSETYESSWTEVVEHVEAAPGLWVGSKGIFELRGGTKRAIAYTSHRVEAEADQWAINAELPPDYFNAEFPVGVNVMDQITGRAYVAAKVSDKMIEKASRELQRLKEAEAELRNSPVDLRSLHSALTRPKSGRLIWVLGIGVAATTAVVVVRRSRKKGSSKG